MMTQRICKRCLLQDLDGEYFASIYAYIQQLPQEQKTDEKEYARRLEICRACESMQNGMCALCGCFVEVRGAKAAMHCPRSSEIW